MVQYGEKHAIAVQVIAQINLFLKAVAVLAKKEFAMEFASLEKELAVQIAFQGLPAAAGIMFAKVMQERIY